jgi:hypothetical protein
LIDAYDDLQAFYNEANQYPAVSHLVNRAMCMSQGKRH